MRTHILEVHALKKKKCTFCGKKFRSTTIGRHIETACKKNEANKMDEQNHIESNGISHMNPFMGAAEETPNLVAVEEITWSPNDADDSGFNDFSIEDFLIFN